jgi:antitoxin component YwqK of YwqJK toxin-antitoxin module
MSTIVDAQNPAQNPRITAGNPRTETYAYRKGGDSIRFTILGTHDTVQITQFYRSGKIEEMSWKQDSSFQYNVLGQLTQKTFGLNKSPNIPNDSTLSFYANGQIRSKTTFKNNLYVSIDYGSKVDCSQQQLYIMPPQ